MLERGLLIWLCLLSLLAFFWNRFLYVPFDPFIASAPFLRWLIAVIMFAIGSLLPRDEVMQIGRRWPTVLFGTALQYLCMPLFAFVFAHLLVSDPHLRAGVILVGCVPGAMASNVLTLMARGNVSYSISLTTTATLLSPFVVPASLYYLLQTVARIDPWEVFVMLMLTVVLPVTAGFFLCQINGRAAGVMKRFGPTAAHLSILWVIAVVVARNRERFDLSGTVLLTLLAVNVAGYLVGYFGGACLKLPEAMRRALTIEIGMQNAGLGSVLANELFASEPRTAIPPVVYTVGCMFTGTLLARWWAGREICDASKSN